MGDLGGGTELVQALAGIVELLRLAVDPLPVGRHQWTQHLRQLLGVGVRQFLHVEDQPPQLSEGRVLLGIVFSRGSRARHLVARHKLGADQRGQFGRLCRHLGVDADSVANGELDVMPVHHRHQLFFEIVVRANRHALAEDRLAIDGLHGQCRLEDMGLVLGSPLFLSVDEKQRDHPVRVSLTDLALDVDVVELGIGGLGLDRFILERHFDDAASVVPLPDPDRLAGAFVDPFFPHFTLVLSPEGRDLDRLRLGIDAERHSDGRRQMPSGNGHILVGRAIVNGVAAAFSQFVGDERRLFVLFVEWRVVGGE